MHCLGLKYSQLESGRTDAVNERGKQVPDVNHFLVMKQLSQKVIVLDVCCPIHEVCISWHVVNVSYPARQGLRRRAPAPSMIWPQFPGKLRSSCALSFRITRILYDICIAS